MMTDQEMIQILEEIKETQFKADNLRFGPKQAQLELCPPASNTEIETLRLFLTTARSLQLPPSYEQFLRISNGAQNFRCAESFHLRGSNGFSKNKEADEGWDFIGPHWQFVIGNGDATRVLAFDPDSLGDDGEMTIAEFDAEAECNMEHANFWEFLKFDLERHQDDLATELQDRANLADD